MTTGQTQGPLSFAISVGAMLLSALTLYLSYFDNRYTLTAAMASVATNVGRSSYSEEGLAEVTYTYIAAPTFILSHRGTRPLVLTDMVLVRSADPDRCVATDEPAHAFAPPEPTMLEPGTLRTVALEFPLGQDEASSRTGEFGLESRTELWCVRLTVFNDHGQREDPLLPAFSLETAFSGPTPDDHYPTAALTAVTARKPVTLASKGLPWF